MATRKPKTATDGTPVEGASQFGVYQFESGSFVFGPVKFVPGVVTPIPDDVELPEDDEPVQVKVFDSAEAAAENAAKLQAKWDAAKGKVTEAKA